MLFRLLLIVFAILIGILSSCESPTVPTAPQDLNRTVTFKLHPTFTFGNVTIGYAAPLRVWFAGTTNNWVVNDPTNELLKDANGDFVLSLPSTKGTVIKFKYIIQTSLSTPKSAQHNLDGDWWTDMGQAYATYPQYFLSPTPSGVSAESDGYSGFNAVYTVN